MTSFRDKLKEIRHDAEETHRHRIPLTDAQLGLTDGTAQCLRVRDEMSNDIERLMLEFVEESPAFHINRGFFEGKYSISLACEEVCPDQRGELDKCFSRINFLLSPCAADGSFAITSKLTVLNRDLPKATIKGVITDDGDKAKFGEFVEAEMVRFAKDYFAARHPTPMPAGRE